MARLNAWAVAACVLAANTQAASATSPSCDLDYCGGDAVSTCTVVNAKAVCSCLGDAWQENSTEPCTDYCADTPCGVGTCKRVTTPSKTNEKNYVCTCDAGYDPLEDCAPVVTWGPNAWDFINHTNGNQDWAERCCDTLLTNGKAPVGTDCSVYNYEPVKEPRICEEGGEGLFLPGFVGESSDFPSLFFRSHSHFLPTSCCNSELALYSNGLQLLFGPVSSNIAGRTRHATSPHALAPRSTKVFFLPRCRSVFRSSCARPGRNPDVYCITRTLVPTRNSAYALLGQLSLFCFFPPFSLASFFFPSSFIFHSPPPLHGIPFVQIIGSGRRNFEASYTSLGWSTCLLASPSWLVFLHHFFFLQRAQS